MFCDNPVLVTLHEMGKVSFYLTGTNGFDLKAGKERFTAASWPTRQNCRVEHFTLFERRRHRNALKCVPHGLRGCFSSFNQSYNLIIFNVFVTVVVF